MYACRQYHLDTSYHRHGMDPHYLDWGNQPDVFKCYPSGESLYLDDAASLPDTSLWEVAQSRPPARVESGITRADVSRILSLAYSLTAERRHAAGSFYYRSVASAGALFPTELYVLIARSQDTAAGLYHYAIARPQLTRLRLGNLSAHVVALVPFWQNHWPAASFFISGIFFRSAWKYRKRAYRYVLLDAGHLLANLVLAQKALGLPVATAYDFDDERINVLIGTSGRREVCLACTAIPDAKAGQMPSADELKPLPADICGRSQVSAAEKSFAEIEKIHAAGYCHGPQREVADDMAALLGILPSTWAHFGKSQVSGDELGLSDAILRRRSRRNYVRRPLSFENFTRLLDLIWLARKHDSAADGRMNATIALGFLAGGVDGLDAGFYLVDAGSRRYGLVKGGAFVEKMAAACLDQKWLAQAAVHFLFMANLECLDRWYGPRGYRYAMLSAGQLGQMVYLGATALGLGACGIGAVYDDEARILLGLNPESSLLYLTAAGPVKQG